MAPGSTTSAAPPNYLATGWTGGRNPWLIAMVVTMATFMEVLDTSIANVSLSHMAGNLGVGRNETTWVLTSYLVANAIVVPMSGWLAVRVGRKRFYMTCVALFTLSSLLCGLAPSLEWLVLFRVLQGLSGGGLGPVEQSILADTFPPEKRGTAMAVYAMTTVLAPAIGPTLGGAITDHFSWRWVFLINIPIGLASLVLTRKIVSDPPHLRQMGARKGRVDWPGLTLIATCLGAFELALEKGQEAGWLDSSFIIAALSVGAVTLVWFIVWELGHDNPVLDLKLLRSRNFAIANMLILIGGFVSYGVTILLPQYLQALLHYSAQQAGLILSPGGITIALFLPLVARLVRKLDARKLIALGFAAVSLALFYSAHCLTTDMDFGKAVELRILQCFGFAFLFVPIQTIAYSGIPAQKFGQVSSMMNLARNAGADLGIASLVTLLYRHRQTHQINLVSNLTAYDARFREHQTELSVALRLGGMNAADAATTASKLVYEEVIFQALQLSYLDAMMWLCAVASIGVPLVCWVKRAGS